jgi:ABC-type anion transport system duplicated permease subunit
MKKTKKKTNKFPFVLYLISSAFNSAWNALQLVIAELLNSAWKAHVPKRLYIHKWETLEINEKQE